jgi:hypothetical protein
MRKNGGKSQWQETEKQKENEEINSSKRHKDGLRRKQKKE